MFVIRSKPQEASVFIIISAKVSVMDVECSWKSQWGIELEEEKRVWCVFFFLLFGQSVELAQNVKNKEILS